MILVLCLDDRGGMRFNRRRQSQDRLLREDLLREAAGRTVWMSGYTLSQFPDPPDNLRPAEDPLDRAGPVGWAVPAEPVCTLSLEGWTLGRSEEFAGSSHEKITKEVYVP